MLMLGAFMSTIRSMLFNTKRFFLGVNKFTPIKALYGDIGWLMPKYHRCLSMVRLWNRLVSLNDSRLTRAVFLQHVAINMENWSSEIQNIIIEFGLEHSFNTLSRVDLNLFKDKLYKRNVKTWKDTLMFKEKLRTHVQFKTEFSTENYIQEFMHRGRSLLAQFRAGVLPLEIECGRWRGIPVEERVCGWVGG